MLYHLAYVLFSNNAFKPHQPSSNLNNKNVARTRYATNDKSSQDIILDNFEPNETLATPNDENKDDNMHSYQLNNSDEARNYLEQGRLNEPSISYSSTWHVPVVLSNSSISTENDEYISNLIRDSENYKFGKISL